MIKKIFTRSYCWFLYYLMRFQGFRKKIRVRLPWLKKSFVLRGDHTDNYTFKQIFAEEEYNLWLGQEPEFIIDAGANVGLAAIYLNYKYPNATIVSIEPELNNFDLLTRNTKQIPNISPLRKALTNNHDSLLKVTDSGDGSWGFITEKIEGAGQSEISDDFVETISVSKIMEMHNRDTVDFLKVDIEGGEVELFSDNYAEWLPKVRCLVIELHDRKRTGTSTAFFKAICQYDFDYYQKGENMIFMNRNLIKAEA